MVQCTAIAGQNPWLLSMSELEVQGMRLFSSMSEGGRPHMVIRRDTGFSLRRGECGSLFLGGSVAVPGELTAPPAPGGQPLSLLVGTGATTTVAGPG